MRFFRDWDGKRRIVNGQPVNGRDLLRGAYPEWGGRLWPDVESVAAELSTLRPAGTDVVDEVHDLPWYQLHHCRIAEALSEAIREREEVLEP